MFVWKLPGVPVRRHAQGHLEALLHGAPSPITLYHPDTAVTYIPPSSPLLPPQ